MRYRINPSSSFKKVMSSKATNMPYWLTEGGREEHSELKVEGREEAVGGRKKVNGVRSSRGKEEESK